MLVIYVDNRIVGSLKGETRDSLEAHIRNGYPHLLQHLQDGTLRAVEMEDTAPDGLVIDKGIPRAMTLEEQTDAVKARDDARDTERAIAAEIRTMAIDRLTAKGMTIE